MSSYSYGFLLDENIAKLSSYCPVGRVKTVHDFELGGRPDAEVIRKAGDEARIVVTADAGYAAFFREAARAQSRDRHLAGLMVITPTDVERQLKLLSAARRCNRRASPRSPGSLKTTAYGLLLDVAYERFTVITLRPH